MLDEAILHACLNVPQEYRSIKWNPKAEGFMAAVSTDIVNDVVVCETEINAPAERIYAALTTADQLARWFADHSCPVKSWRMDARKGGRWFMGTAARDKPMNGVSEFRAGGVIVEMNSPRTLAYTWHANWHDDPSLASLVRYELKGRGNITTVKVTHSGLAEESLARADYNSGWPVVLKMLEKFVEE